ncbi:DUF4255 domain-containing protein [Saccharophagus degradans]|uniref:DUF4255 domain-containing protein n=1 Tax=Saccharophagus degradans TaxID=86304 RepID=A0AAW7X961_9GAMM|nr:DUF4255 domain-containing protein [Saccharophagus degradans]MDO6423999.1 DUF4255 domain-containing protein [Saccharophagus degradans]MDO6609162.1 DUF4255 domain-containing protein [Saccharophagus degradans]WGO97525.1 DUF4255 domain-containing protein [Saccharophagus degradans]
MLDVALKFLAGEVNAYLKSRTGLTDDIVELNPVVDEAGKYLISDGGVSIVLINMEEETATREQTYEYQYHAGQHVKLQPELKLNLYLMFAANFKLYDQALKYLSHVLTFFQSHKLFTPQSHPALDSSIQRLALDMQSLSFDQLNQVWAYIGGKHLPSVVYKARLIAIQDQSQDGVQPPISIVNTSAGGM